MDKKFYLYKAMSHVEKRMFYSNANRKILDNPDLDDYTRMNNIDNPVKLLLTLVAEKRKKKLIVFSDIRKKLSAMANYTHDIEKNLVSFYIPRGAKLASRKLALVI